MKVKAIVSLAGVALILASSAAFAVTVTTDQTWGFAVTQPSPISADNPLGNPNGTATATVTLGSGTSLGWNSSALFGGNNATYGGCWTLGVGGNITLNIPKAGTKKVNLTKVEVYLDWYNAPTTNKPIFVAPGTETDHTTGKLGAWSTGSGGTYTQWSTDHWIYTIPVMPGDLIPLSMSFANATGYARIGKIRIVTEGIEEVIVGPGAVTVDGAGTYCGSTTLTATGGSGGTIYFQGTTSDGMSTATASASAEVSASGTYYFRAYNGSSWGVEGSATVVINAVPAAVSVGTSGTYTGSTTLTATGGSGGTIYFQGATSGGTSTATASTSAEVSASGTYYFRAYNGSCWGAEGSATVVINAVPEPAYGINNRAAYDPIISTALASLNFRVWGKVSNLVIGSSFDVNDGSGAVVKVVAPGFSGILDGDYASASGKFTGEGLSRVLNAKASDVVKL